jgi:hypothetical protein
MPMAAPAAPQPQYSTLPPQMPSPFAAAAAPPPVASMPNGTVQRPRAPAPTAPSLTGDSIAERPAGGRRWGLIAFILLVDLGLAGAGAWMLNESRGGAAAPPPVESAK